VFADRRKPFSEEKLKLRICECWDAIDIGSIRAVIKVRKGRLMDIIVADGNREPYPQHVYTYLSKSIKL